MIKQEILTKKVLKYRVAELLAGLTEEYRVKVKKEVQELHDFNEVTMSRYLNIPKSAKQTMPADVLRTFSSKLNVPMEKLFN
jgi:transcription initiation factor TFIIIB Brf1 subunit/transcription initiation factor TFIIB